MPTSSKKVEATMKSRTRYCLLAFSLSVVLSGPGCHSGASAKPIQHSASNLTVATYNDKNITLKEIDKLIQHELDELNWQRYRLRESQIKQVIVQDLIEAKAKQENITTQELLQRYIVNNTKTPTEAEAKDIFERQVKPRQPNATFEEFKTRIIDHLQSSANQATMETFVAELQKSANVKIVLEKPPVTRVSIAPSGVSKGPAGAPITIVEFADFQCGYCSQISETLNSLLQAYPNKIRLVFKHFPLSFHKDAQKASEASLCANDQGKFWEFHDMIFANQAQMQVPKLKEHASALGLNMEQFNECLTSDQHQSAVLQDYQVGEEVGVQGTPSVFINGIRQRNLDLASLSNAVDEELKLIQ